MSLEVWRAILCLPRTFTVHRAPVPALQVYKQRIKHLLFEHQNETTERKTEGQISLKMGQDEHRTSEAQLKKDKRALKVELKEMQTAHDDFMRSLKMVRALPSNSTVEIGSNARVVMWGGAAACGYG